MNHKTWIVVASSSLARFLEVQKSQKLIELKVMEHPGSKLHGRDLVTDKPGREFSGMSQRRSSVDAIDPHQNEAEHFAIQVAQYLDHAHRSQAFEKICLIASPAFLGLLRQSLADTTQKTIFLNIDKDLTNKDLKEIRGYLPPIL